MIAQYKREQEEQNKYVDPITGDQFQYAPAGTAPTFTAPALVDLLSLGNPATTADVGKEQTNFDKILQDIKDKKQEIEDKKREVREKEKEMKSGRIRSQGNYCLPPAGVLHSQNKVTKCAAYGVAQGRGWRYGWMGGQRERVRV